MAQFYIYSYDICNNALQASADAALSCKPGKPVTRGGRDTAKNKHHIKRSLK